MEKEKLTHEKILELLKGEKYRQAKATLELCLEMIKGKSIVQ